MKKTNLSLRGFLAPVFFLLMFFVGVGTMNAQSYVTVEEAFIILKDEVISEEVKMNNPDVSVREAAAFKLKYYHSIMAAMTEGNGVEESVVMAEPQDQPKVHSSGLVEFRNDGNFKAEKAALVEYTIDLLTE